jgi:intracellular septation protein
VPSLPPPTPDTGAPSLPTVAQKHPHPVLHFIMEILPLVVFFVAYRFGGLRVATFAIMGVTALSVLYHYATTRRVPFFTMITALVVGVFGTLTLVLHNDAFIKMKPAMVYLLFAGIIAVGQARSKNPMQRMFGHAFSLTERGWGILSWRWVGFFVAMAVANELCWRVLGETAWVNFKVFGAMPTMLIFAALQYRLLQREKQV